jgi:hypothetical protein
MSDLIVHAGGWEATKGDLASVPLPEATTSYVPVPHGRLVEELELHIPRFGLKIHDEQFALARDGAQMFGVISCTNGHLDDWCLAIGLRNSYDRSLAVGLTVGHRVFCCDNLAFQGEVTAERKHTVNVFRDLPDLLYRMLNQVSTMKARQAAEIDFYKSRELAELDVEHLVMQTIRHNAFPASKVPRLLEVWDTPGFPEFEPRTAWSLLNAFTEVQKSRSPQLQMDDGLKISNVFRSVLSPA